MALRTEQEYLDGLRDGRVVHYQGGRVDSVPDHPELGVVARHTALDFRLAQDPEHADLAVVEDGDQRYSAYYALPTSAEDLARRSELIAAATEAGATLVVLIKEIGSDALFALTRVARRFGEEEMAGRVSAFLDRCRREDLAVAVAQTDVKGDRRKAPSQLDDPDLYVRVVEERDDGIVVRGAKAHTSYAPMVDEIIVLPSRSMREGDEDWSVSFAVPVATEGLALYTSDFFHGEFHPWTHPVSSDHRMVETLTVFDDVFVPWERVFFSSRPDLATASALGFVEYHRFTAVSYKLPLLDALVGAALAVAQANGIEGAGHVRDKLTWLAAYAETVGALIETAATRAGIEQGVAHPHVLTTNLAKWTFARDFHTALHHVQDLAGGLVVTGPGGPDWESDEIRPVLDKYLGAAWPADERMAVINLISDLTARLYGGYQEVLAVHAEGSIEAEKLALVRSYDTAGPLRYARRLAGLDPDGPGGH